MTGLPLRAKIYCCAVVSAAVVVFSWSTIRNLSVLQTTFGLTSPSEAITSLTAFAAIVAAGLYPIRLGQKLRMSVSAAVIFGAALLFHPLRIMALAGLGVAASRAINVLIGSSPKVPLWQVYDAGFNGSQTMLSAGVAAMLFHGLSSVDAGVLRLDDARAFAVVAAAGLCYFLVNMGVISLAASLSFEIFSFRGWVGGAFRGWNRSAALLLTGVALAIVYIHTPLAVFIFAIPLYIIHQAFSVSMAIKTQTKQTLETLADAIDKRDPYTYEHSQRVALFAQLTAKRLGLTEEDQQAIELAARVHDLGKMGVREELLKKPDRLTGDELEEVRRHTLIGAEIVSKLADYSRSREAILYHHERWDGSGLYRLAYDHIPIGARIITVADAYDAMTSDRPYRQALSPDVACAELQKGKGTHFDPVVVEAFIDAVPARTLAPATGLPAPERIAPQPSGAQIRH